jgi:hypothetical protein
LPKARSGACLEKKRLRDEPECMAAELVRANDATMFVTPFRGAIDPGTGRTGTPGTISPTCSARRRTT